MYNIDQLTSSLSFQGVSYKSDFQVRINTTQKFRNKYTRIAGVAPDYLTAQMAFRIESTELPGRSVQTVDYRDHGVVRKIGYNAQYMEIGIEVICSEDLREKEFFDVWQDIIVGAHRSGGLEARYDNQFNVGYYDDYICSVDIIQFNRQTQNPIYTIKLEEAYPLSVSPMAVSWSDSEIHKLSVQFAYRYYTHNLTNVPTRQEAREQFSSGPNGVPGSF